MNIISQAAVRLGSSERAKKLGSASPASDVIKLNIGEPSFITPDYICQAAIEAIHQGYTHYAPYSGDSELRRIISEQLSMLGGGSFLPEDVIITNGASSAIYSAMVAYLDPGDEVLLHDPTYSLYQDVALTIGATAVFVPWVSDFRLDINALEKAITPRTRLFVLNNPSNPTGTVLTKDETEAVVDFVIRHDLILISDEAYDFLVYDDLKFTSMASFKELADRVIIINTCSKTFAMTGWRVGYMAGRNGLIKPADAIHRTTLHCVNWIAQRAALKAYSTETSWQNEMLTEFAKRRELMCSLVNEIPGLSCRKPEGTFYVLVKVEIPMTSENLAQYLMEHGVAVRSGTEYGRNGEGFIRLSFAGEIDQFQPGIARLALAMRALN